jgi:predicted DNA-binding transcriptional regulator YafY
MAKQLLRTAMQRQDDLVLSLVYVDSKGNRTTRVVSPIRFLSNDRFLGLCLCRCEPRQFHLDRCSNLELKQASDYVMPVPMSSAS